MSTVVGECAAVLCRQLEAVQANADPSSFQNCCMDIQRFGSPESNGNSQLAVKKCYRSSGAVAGGCPPPPIVETRRKSVNVVGIFVVNTRRPAEC
jgi:hypothetical protein